MHLHKKFAYFYNAFFMQRFQVQIISVSTSFLLDKLHQKFLYFHDHYGCKFMKLSLLHQRNKDEQNA